MNISLEQLKEAAIEIISKGSSDKGQDRSQAIKLHTLELDSLRS